MAEPQFTLVKAIKVAWDAAVTAGTISGLGTPHREDRMRGRPIAYPYVVILVESSNRSTITFQSDHTDHALTFRVYDVSSTSCAAHAGMIKAVFDSRSQTFTLAEGEVSSKLPGRVVYVKVSPGEWYVDVRYEFVTGKAKVA